MKLNDKYTIRTEDLLRMLHHQWLLGYIVCTIEDMEGEPALVPVDKGGSQTEAWFKNLAGKLAGMKCRRDGTHFLPDVKPRKNTLTP